MAEKFHKGGDHFRHINRMPENSRLEHRLMDAKAETHRLNDEKPRLQDAMRVREEEKSATEVRQLLQVASELGASGQRFYDHHQVRSEGGRTYIGPVPNERTDGRAASSVRRPTDA